MARFSFYYSIFPMSFGWNSKFFTREKEVCLVGRDIKVVFHSRMSIRLDYQPLFRPGKESAVPVGTRAGLKSRSTVY